MINFGLEREYFLVHKETGIPIMPEDLKLDLPIDSCGYLVEARGAAYTSIYSAVYSVLAIQQELEHKLESTDYKLSLNPILSLSKDFLNQVSRRYSKGIVSYQNYMGHTNHRLKQNERTAGIHLSITDRQSYIKHVAPNHAPIEVFYNKNFDWFRWFMALDYEFEQEIRDSKRNKGFYELKFDGRIEYRSLPTNINFEKLMIFITKLYKTF